MISRCGLACSRAPEAYCTGVIEIDADGRWRHAQRCGTCGDAVFVAIDLCPQCDVTLHPGCARRSRSGRCARCEREDEPS